MTHAHEPVKIGDIITHIIDDEPFLDPEELADTHLRWMRDVLRRRFNFNKSRNNGKSETSD